MRKILFFSLLFAASLHAGKGMIALTPLTRAISPVERAILVYNGKEEIIVLSNDAQATQPTGAWEIMPFRSKPVVEYGDISWIEFADSLLNQLVKEKCKTRTLEEILSKNNALLDNKIVKPSDVYKWKAHVGYSGFLKWLEKKLYDEYCVEEVPDEVKEAIYYYSSHGFRHWVVDVVDLDMEIATVAPLLYRFKTRRLYYPIRMSASSPGLKVIMLYIVSKKKIGTIEAPGYKVFGPFEIPARRLTSLYPDIVDFMGVQPDQPLYFMGLIYSGQNVKIPPRLPLSK